MIFNYTLYGSEIPCELYAEQYAAGSKLALVAIVANDFDDGDMKYYAGEEMATLTVNLGLPLKPNQCALDTNNNKNIIRDFEKQKIRHATGEMGHSRFCDYPIWEFSDREMRCFGRF